MKGTWFAYVYLGPRPRARRQYGSFHFVKGSSIGQALRTHTVEFAKWKLEVDAYHDTRSKPVLQAGGVYCVYHSMDLRECYPRHAE